MRLVCQGVVRDTLISMKCPARLRFQLRRGSLRSSLHFERRLVGARGFEPPTPCSQSKCATRLRHAPIEKYHMNKTSAKSSHKRLNRPGGRRRQTRHLDGDTFPADHQCFRHAEPSRTGRQRTTIFSRGEDSHRVYEDNSAGHRTLRPLDFQFPAAFLRGPESSGSKGYV